ICVISTDDARDRALASAALAFIAKPIQSRDILDGMLDYVADFLDRPMKSLLVVESKADRRDQIRETLAAEDIQVTTVADAPAAAQMLQERRVDCMVVGSSDTEVAKELLSRSCPGDNALGRLPVIAYAQEEPDAESEAAWRKVADSCTVRRVHSPDRLLDQAILCLHRPSAKLSENKRQVLLDLHQSDKLLSGKKVLIVDDDMRNIFALSSVLEEHDMVVSSADNGRDAIRMLQDEVDVDIVLMDIMMPEMDGMETMRAIRKVPELKNLPIVAVTAKAMKGDREKCIEAGAWDYLSKPVDTEQMLAVLRAWLHRGRIGRG